MEKFKQHYQEMLSETLLSLDNVKEKQVVKVKKPIVKKAIKHILNFLETL